MYGICRWIFGAAWRKNVHLARSLRREWRPARGKARDRAFGARNGGRRDLGDRETGIRKRVMEKVPQIVSARLRTAAAEANRPDANHLDASHPDADVLTAFAEKSLLETERAQVMDHLALCGDCRDVLALALPATESMEQVMVPSRGSWFSWPVLRWGF